MIQHRSPISGVAAFEDRYVATAGYDNQVILWDARTGSSIERGSHDQLANQCRFSPDGRFLITASSDYTVRVWNVPQMRLHAVLGEHKDDVPMAAPHPTEAMIATACYDSRIRVFDYDGRLIHEVGGHDAPIESVEWSAEGTHLISSGDDGTIRRWPVTVAGRPETFDLGNMETDTVALAPDGTVYAGNDAGEVVVLAPGRDATHVKAHSTGIKRLAFEPRTGLLASSSYDQTLGLFLKADRDEGLRLHRTVELPSIVWPRSCAFSGPGRIVFATFGSRYATYHLDDDHWDLENVSTTHGLNAVILHRGHVLTVDDAGTVCEDGRSVARLGSLCNFLLDVGGTVLAGGQAGKVFDALNGQVLYRHHSPLNCGAVFTHQGRPHVIIGTYTGEGLVFAVEPAMGLRLVRVVRLHNNAVKGVTASERHIFSLCATRAAALHSTATLEPERHLTDAHEQVSNACVTLPGGRFASVGRDRTLRLWDGEQVEVVPSPHRRSIKCLAASPDGQQVATGGYDGRVWVYDAAQGRWMHSQRPTTFGIAALTAGTHAGQFLAAAYDGHVHLIDTDA